MKIAITGGTGFIGSAIINHMASQGHQCLALVRNTKKASSLPCTPLKWNGASHQWDDDSLSKLYSCDAWIHLAGEPIADRPWSDAVKKSILESRTLSTINLIDALARIPKDRRPKVIIAGSAIGIYGSRDDEELDELSTKGSGFLSDVVKHWEDQSQRFQELGVRLVIMRTGIVLGSTGGALQKMQPVILGAGQQWMSWIHLDDVVRFVDFAIKKDSVHGVFNLTAPQPCRNSTFTKLLAKSTGFPFTPKVPQFLLKITLGEMASILLDSTKALPKAALAAGFQFQYADLPSALREIFPAPLERRFRTWQFIPRSIDETFPFFSKAENLERITPPWLNFKILKSSTTEVTENTLIDYKLRIHGLPVKWRTRIADWQPGKQFVDTQVKGPYNKWHHTHRFISVPGGTLMIDDVVFQLPFGSLGLWFGSFLVRRDIESIFNFRRRIIEEIFSLKI